MNTSRYLKEKINFSLSSWPMNKVGDVIFIYFDPLSFLAILLFSLSMSGALRLTGQLKRNFDYSDIRYKAVTPGLYE